ncbi:hypothetical protein [Polynucleobacter sp. UB-Piko-W3]|uniref:hypothetical protein n=1 Tax=Polynucleobacter sp. UB-Piko-W3 TaxID=1819735 RepID=UPI001C0E1AEB|nr:hypothetical protein [Polynucleobacter sp. UB-Piko-W3]MBU3554733.1 hypothetical protein [Polynucleobacter sp. UB-Piko-W3]
MWFWSMLGGAAVSIFGLIGWILGIIFIVFIIRMEFKENPIIATIEALIGVFILFVLWIAIWG